MNRSDFLSGGFPDATPEPASQHREFDHLEIARCFGGTGQNSGLLTGGECQSNI
ncbi:hypothetical protein [Bradyrhizobium nanningense]|uniref:hypothetical protein n=1 Tax=Bradyrhizobium nanningense TaxID=1325118 RepID=UPI0013E8F1E7|nr:hypothetical protein [Bradyrhizobium nanningense]